MTTFYEGDNTGLREVAAPRYIPAADDHGKWGVQDTNQPRPSSAWLGARYDTPEAAEAFADLLNAVDEGQPANVIEDLRGDLDRVRNPGSQK